MKLMLFFAFLCFLLLGGLMDQWFLLPAFVIFVMALEATWE